MGFAAASIGLEMATSIPAMGPLMAQIVFGGTQITGGNFTDWKSIKGTFDQVTGLNTDSGPVSYTHLTLPTKA